MHSGMVGRAGVEQYTQAAPGFLWPQLQRCEPSSKSYTDTSTCALTAYNTDQTGLRTSLTGMDRWKLGGIGEGMGSIKQWKIV